MNKEAYLEQIAATRDERMRWWREARFGMFAPLGVVLPVGSFMSGSMNRERIPRR